MRYIRQTPIITSEGQKKLEKAAVAVVGIGALGGIAAELLARAGVGEIRIIDRDLVDEGNLQRQTLFEEQDIGKLKAVVASEKLKRINRKLVIKTYPTELNAETSEILENVDLILDGTDNFDARFLINEYCRKNNLPWVFSAVVGTKGQVWPILPEGPCLRCIFQEPTESLGTCETEGILNTLPRMIAAFQVTEALKILTNKTPSQKLLLVDPWQAEIQSLEVKENPACPVCNQKFEYLNGKKSKEIVSLCSDLYQFKTKNKPRLKVTKKDQYASFFKKGAVLKDGRVLIKAKSKEQAQAFFDRYFG
ncbi:HesA/MoeB/ThiF family protein [Candidatus Woesearchaeota archaeon]|nr:HesA/MoeB/ThiF family protein [Candidatus Woesearchaeota archaeon]